MTGLGVSEILFRSLVWRAGKPDTSGRAERPVQEPDTRDGTTAPLDTLNKGDYHRQPNETLTGLPGACPPRRS